MEEKQISEVASKMAESLAGENLHKDDYHACITRAARTLVDAGKGDLFYRTQYGSGSTTWSDSRQSRIVTVSRDGEIGNILTAVALVMFGLAVVVSAYLVLTLGVQGILQVVDALASL